MAVVGGADLAVTWGYFALNGQRQTRDAWTFIVAKQTIEALSFCRISTCHVRWLSIAHPFITTTASKRFGRWLRWLVIIRMVSTSRRITTDAPSWYTPSQV